MKKRKLYITALLAVAIACFVCFGTTLAGAEPAKGTFAFKSGASVRYDEQTGLRFIVELSGESYADLVENETYKDGKNMKVYIAPAEYFEKAQGDMDALAAKAAVAEIKAESIYAAGDVYRANAVLANILYENTAKEFRAVAAIESAGERTYSEVSDARSIAYVSSAALADETKDYTSEQKELLNTFVQKAIAHAENVPESDFENGSYDVEIAMEESLLLELGEAVDLTATLAPAIGLYTEWKSDNEEVAVVDENGKVTAVGEGDAVITVTVYGKTATCNVHVKAYGVIADFETEEQLNKYIYRVTNEGELKTNLENGALKVEVLKGEAGFGGWQHFIVMPGTMKDFTKYAALNFDLRNPNNSAFSVEISLTGCAGATTITFAANSTQSYSIPICNIAPGGGDFSNITEVNFIITGSSISNDLNEFAVYFDNFRLSESFVLRDFEETGVSGSNCGVQNIYVMTDHGNTAYEYDETHGVEGSRSMKVTYRKDADNQWTMWPQIIVQNPSLKDFTGYRVAQIYVENTTGSTFTLILQLLYADGTEKTEIPVIVEKDFVGTVEFDLTGVKVDNLNELGFVVGTDGAFANDVNEVNYYLDNLSVIK